MKFAVLGLVIVAVGLVGYYLLELNGQRTVKSELQSLEAEYAKQGPRAEKAKARETEISETLKVSKSLVDRMENRFYWAPVLASVAQVVPQEVQLTKLSGDVTSDEKRQCSLTIEGVAAGADPRKTAEDLRRALAEKFSTKYKAVTSVFRSLEDSPETVALSGKQFPTASFGIHVAMHAGEDPAPPVPPVETASTAKK